MFFLGNIGLGLNSDARIFIIILAIINKHISEDELQSHLDLDIA